MKRFLILAMITPSFVMAAVPQKKMEFTNLKVEKTEAIDYDGQEGLLVKFKGIKKRAYFPKENNKNERIFSMLEKAESDDRRLDLEVARVENDVVMYRSGSLTEVMTVGGDCQKIMSQSKSPRLFCNKGFAVKRIKVKKLKK